MTTENETWQAEANAQIEALMKLIDEVCGFHDGPALYPLLMALELLNGDPEDEERIRDIMCFRLDQMVQSHESLSADIIATLQGKPAYDRSRFSFQFR